MSNGVLIIGGNVASLQAALDLADSGISVDLVTAAPFLSTDAPDHVQPHELSARILEVLRHPQITVRTNTDIQEIEPDPTGFRADLRQRPRYVSLDTCTACEDCITTCPVIVPDTDRTAIYLDGQPGCAAIDRPGKAPCSGTCPGGIHVQGYVALIAQKRYQEAIDLIREAIPFPSVCGRVCNHYCEANCTRGKVDAALNIMALKRFVADWEYANRGKGAGEQGGKRDDLQPTQLKIHNSPSTIHNSKRIAIIGAGPSGLTAARDLVRLGYPVTVFDALPVAGGMMRVGIPPHRLPTELLDWEIQQIIDEGVELKLNTWIDDIPGLLENGFEAVLIATGAHRAKKLSLRNSNHPDNWLSLDILRRTCLGEDIDLSGKKVIVLGGGNVALDTVRTVVRLGADEVRMACLETRGEMPGFEWEIGVAEDEGVEISPGRTFKEIVVEENRIMGVRCVEVDFRGFKGGRPDFDEIPGTEHILPADLVIWAIGQEPDFSFLPHDGSIDTRFPFGIRSNENMMTTLPGVFVSGDVHRGQTFFVIDAIGEGHKAARSMDRYLRGETDFQEAVPLQNVEFSPVESRHRYEQSQASGRLRVEIPSLPLADRVDNFHEVDLVLTEEAALTEASRCLLCGSCSECLACVAVCPTGAIDHDQPPIYHSLKIEAVINAEPDIVLSVSEAPSFYQLPPPDAIRGSAVAAQVLPRLNGADQGVAIGAAQVDSTEPARIGVFVCQCGTEPATGKISASIDTQSISAQAAVQPDVIHSQVLPFSCSPEAAQTIQTASAAHALDRVVLAACSCCYLDQVCYSCTYQRVRSKNNLGLFSPVGTQKFSLRGSKLPRFEFVNIREQCAWVHPDDPATSTIKATKLVTATIARARAAPGVLAGARGIEKSALILGNGLAAPHSLEVLSLLGINAHQVAEHPLRISRARGLYWVAGEGQSWEASTLILIPRDAAELQGQLAAFGRVRRHPQVHTTWGGLDTHRPGVFVITPEMTPEIAGPAAAARVAAWIGRTESRPPTAAVVDPDRCRACKTCIDTCEYCAPELIETNGRYASWIDPAICVSCGTCAAHCPSGAITAGCSTDAQLDAMLDVILG